MRNICSKLIVVVVWIHCISKAESKAGCKPIVTLTCPEKRYTYYDYHQKVDAKPGCKKSEITDISWVLQTQKGRQVVAFPEASKKRFLALPAEMAEGGAYQLVVKVKESKSKHTTTAMCKFKYVTEPPIIIYANGYSTHVLYGHNYTIDIRPSKHFGKGALPPVTWRAQCHSRNESDPKFTKAQRELCKNKPGEDEIKGTFFTAQASFCCKSVVYRATILHDGINVTRGHCTIHANEYDCLVQVVCEKNCDGAGSKFTNIALPMVLSLKEDKATCKDFAKMKPNWAFKIYRGASLGPDQYILLDNNHRAIVKANQLQAGQLMHIHVKIKDAFYSWFEVNTAPIMTPAPTCTITPATGLAIQTEFQVQCKTDLAHFKLYAPRYVVYQTVNGIRRRVTSSSDANFSMSLAKGSNIEIIARDLYADEVKCTSNPVTVNEVQVNEDALKTSAKLISARHNEGDPGAVAMSGAFVMEVANSNMDPKVKAHHLKSIMREMKKFKITNMDQFYEIADLTNVFLTVDPLPKGYRDDLGDFCKKMSGKHVDLLNTVNYPKYREAATILQAELSAKCAERLLGEAPENATVGNETPVASTVQKPDLGDKDKEKEDGQSSDELESDEDKIAAVEIFEKVGLAVSQTLGIGEERNISKKVLVLKHQATSLANKKIKMAELKVIPGDSFKKLGPNEVSVVIAKYSGKELMLNASDVVDINFYRKTVKLKTMDYKVEFPVEGNTVPYRRFNVKLPPAWDQETVLNSMNVHRLNVFPGFKENVVINVSAGTNLFYGFSVNRRPTEIPFSLSGPNETFLKEVYPIQIADVFGYIAISPHRTMPQTTPYDIRMIGIACTEYNKEKLIWTTRGDCSANLDRTFSKVICTCKSTSLHSIIYKEVENRLEEYHDVYEMQLEDFTNYTIFFHGIIVLACFLIALAFTIIRKPEVFGRNKIFFLSDNLKNDRFCYLLLIKTGVYQGAGTTANIMIQLFGTQGESKPHVLNYPDPACAILQRDNIDWFALACDVHLGDVTSILLWTDSIGFYPKWNCEDVTVLDLQTRRNYYFKVETWLSALAQHTHFVKIASSPSKGKQKEDISVSLVKHIRLHWNAVHTWNIFIRGDVDITYAERLTVILSMIYMTYSLCAVFEYHPTLRYSDTFAFGEYRFYTEFLWIPFVVSFPTSTVHLSLCYFLRHSEHVTKNVVLVAKKKRHSYRMRLLCLCILYVIIVLCMMHLLVFGFWVTIPSSYVWMTTSCLSLLLSIFLWENVFINVLSLILARFGKPEEFLYQIEAIIREIERQRFILFKKFGEVQMRPYFQKHYRLMTPNEIFDLRQIITKREEVAKLVMDLCIFLVYIIILYLICIIFFTDDTYEVNKMMQMMIEDGYLVHGTYKLENITNTHSIYEYIEHLLIPTIHGETWYGTYKMADEGLMADFSTRVLGVVQLRQQRRIQKCNIPNEMKNMKIPCTNDGSTFKGKEFYDGADIPTSLGNFKTYDGSGYLIRLGRTRKASMHILSMLKKHHWIDINSEVVFIEFFAYNVNMNMFNAVRIMIERSNTGHVLKSTNIYTCRLLFISATMEIFIGFLLVALLMCIIVLIIKRFFQSGAKPKVFFMDFWNCLDLVLTLLIVAQITVFFQMKQETYELLIEIIGSDVDQFHNYFYLVSLSELTTIFYGVLVSLSTMRLWKYLHFGRLFRLMEHTILIAGPQLMTLFLCELIAFIMITMFIYPIAGSHLVYFRTFYITVMRIYLASINFAEHLNNADFTTDTTSIYLLYAGFLVCSTCFNNFYCTALILNLEISRLDYSTRPDAYTVQNYTSDFTRFYNEKFRRHLINFRLRGGGRAGLDRAKIERLFYPKNQNHRYADMVHTNRRKMKLMQLIAVAVIRSRNRFGHETALTDDDCRLMATILITHFSKEDESDAMAYVFFKMSDPITNAVRFIPNRRIVQMEKLTKYMLDSEVPEDDTKIQTDITDRLTYCQTWLQTIRSIVENIRVKDMLVPPIHPMRIMQKSSKMAEGPKS